MKAQEIMGTVNQNGQLSLDEPLMVNTSSRVKVIVLFLEPDINDEDDESKKLVLESLQTSLQQVTHGKTRPVSELWDGIDAK